MKKITFLEKILIAVLSALLLAIATISVWALVFRNKATELKSNTIAEDGFLAVDTTIFTGIGRLRIQLKPSSTGQTSTLVIAPVFPYNNSDKAFTEELATQLRNFRSSTEEYLSTLSPDVPEFTDELTLKKEILARYNSFLRLGKIEALYFTDFMIID
jgi:flagellar basal body-associated protein FliL